MNNSLKMHHRYICWVYDWLGKIQIARLPQPPQPLKVTANLKSLKSNTCSYKICLLSKKKFIVPIDKELNG